MRTIERSSAFKKDYKKVKSQPNHKEDIDTLLTAVLALLNSNQPLPVNNRDHALSGDWDGYRDCHLKPDLLLLYSKPDEQTLRLVRLGSHSDLFG